MHTLPLFAESTSIATTHNGAITNLSSNNCNVDLFSLIGSSRNADITEQFSAALAENSNLAIRILLWARDIRQGAGERNTFRVLFNQLCSTNLEVAVRVIQRIPELGRWDDLLVAFETPAEIYALREISTGLASNNALLAKWLPRRGNNANTIRKYLKLTPKEYRRKIVDLSSTVEQTMCSNAWGKIEYSHVPSAAAARYQSAFIKHDSARYALYKANLITGKETINAAALYPYDVIRSLRNGDADIAMSQWAALPDYLQNTNEKIISVVDTSGSMSCSVSGSISALDVAMSLGLYVSERATGIFKDKFITFSGTPEMVEVFGSLQDKVNLMLTSNWGMNTDIAAVFKLILNNAVDYNTSACDMPTRILILSDMEFDACTYVDKLNSSFDLSAMELIKRLYADAGYVCPSIVFWNLNARAGNVPVKFNESGAALVSGCSPTILKTVLSCSSMDPHSVMLNTVLDERYNF